VSYTTTAVRRGRGRRQRCAYGNHGKQQVGAWCLHNSARLGKSSRKKNQEGIRPAAGGFQKNGPARGAASSGPTHLPGAPSGRCVLQARYSGDGGDHHARQKLHGSNVAGVESTGGRGQHLEDAQRAPVVP